ncbi:M56 family metallopeptidase [Maribacter sp. ACAM166]|uniref:M56 family metallopeptidase n=1 Tax=Maribacter sp. ACAM166 TaxID=2508996 RepID=UPI0010FD2E81|nr:M56 family metallopeptidase [Maribacter sp. ACAM166]TLP74523.1 M56 family metallopeptidase [Maribacter sp. ACAM166]
MSIFLLKSTACMAVFLLFYKLLLEKESIHTFKRFYLLVALVTSLIIPNLVFTEYVEIAHVNLSKEIPVINFTDDAQLTQLYIKESIFNWELALWSFYGIGVLGFGFRFVRHLVQIGLRVCNNPKVKNSFIVKVLLQEQLPPHTFFSYIFLNKQKFETNSIPDAVLLHEETHARQKHSLDVLFIELIQVLFWFNPLIYIFKKSIKLNHEFLADSAVILKNEDQISYQNILLAYLSNDSFNKHQSTGVANAINYSSIKKRFKIMKKQTSKKSIILRSFLFLPLIGLLLLGFTEKKIVQISKNNSVVNEVGILIENVEIRIDNEGNLFLQYNLQSTFNNLEINLYNLNKNLSKEEREQQVKAVINLEADTPQKLIEEVDRILMEYGVAQLNILGPEPAYIGNLIETVTEQSQIKKYNTLSKKYNAIPIEKRIIPLKDLEVLETIFKSMSKVQKGAAQPFPEYLPRQNQESATKKQVTEYNKLAKEYNAMMAKGGNIRIMKSDVDRLTHIYELMSDDQKTDAAPFPDFPEPPPAPKAPRVNKGEKSNIPTPPLPKEPKTNAESFPNFPAPPRSPKAPTTRNTTNYANKQLREIIQNQDPYDMNHISLKTVSGIPVTPNTFYSGGDVENLDFKAQENMKVYIHNSSSSKTDNSPNLMENLYSLEKQDAQFYFDGKKITSEEGFEIIENEKNIKIETLPYSNKQPEVRIYKEDNDLRIPPPPVTPTPKSPLDYAIDMAKKGATFMYEGQEVSSDKAIDLLKNNKELNIESRNKNGKTIVRITKDPVTID